MLSGGLKTLSMRACFYAAGKSARLALVLCTAAAFAAVLPACSPVDAEGTIPRNSIKMPRSTHRMTVIREMTFEYGENQLSRRSVIIPPGEYVLEGEDELFSYFRAPNSLEYRLYHKEGYADGIFQLGGLAIARRDKWEETEFPVCTYTDGDKQNRKRLTCPINPSLLMQKRGFDWESDFDAKTPASPASL